VKTRLMSAAGLVLASLAAPAWALQVVDVTDGQTVTVKVSARELTRIGMAGGGRLTRVWGLEDRMQVQADKESGQIFVRPAAGGRPFSFFVRDENGATYTLIATPVDMPSDTVLLRPRAARDRPGDGRGADDPYVARIKSLVRALARDTVPAGYTRVSVGRPVPLWQEARITMLARYEGPLTAEVYELTNVSGAEMRLDEREFGVMADNIRAVAIQVHALSPGESTRIYVVRGTR